MHNQVFTFVLKHASEELSLTGLDFGVDSTMIEANAAMKSIVRKETGEDWKEYLKRLMIETGDIEEDDEPNDEDLRRFDRKRSKKGEKNVSNTDWESPTDPDSRIVKMKDGRTHLGYKLEHVIDLETELILHAGVHQGTDHDTQTLVGNVVSAQVNLDETETDAEVMNVVVDKGYYKAAVLTQLQWMDLSAHIPEKSNGTKLSRSDPHYCGSKIGWRLAVAVAGRNSDYEASEWNAVLLTAAKPAERGGVTCEDSMRSANVIASTRLRET